MPEGASASTDVDVASAGPDNVSPAEVEGATTIDAAQAKALVDAGVAVVDVRWDWSTGHLAGALNLDVYTEFTEENLSASVAKDEKVVMYGRGVGPHTARACARAASWGFEKIYYFREGFIAWKAAGYPVVVPPE
jgi:rhodanese-related sulfurtransferase